MERHVEAILQHQLACHTRFIHLQDATYDHPWSDLRSVVGCRWHWDPHQAASIVHQPAFPGETVLNLHDVSTFLKFSHFTCDFSVWSLLYHSSQNDQRHFSAYKCLQYSLLLANCKLRLIQRGKAYTVAVTFLLPPCFALTFFFL